MAYFLFIDESGQDHKNSPYEVLAGIAIQDTLLWQLIKDVHDIELNCFGRRYRHDGREIKATKFLNTKTFRLAGQMAPINMPERTALAKLALDNGESTNKKQLTTLARARSNLIIPEPFFVHSDLTTGIQIVDFIAYLFSWNFRVPKLTKPGRTELNSYIEMLKPMRYKTTRVIGENNNHIIWSVTPV